MFFSFVSNAGDSGCRRFWRRGVGVGLLGVLLCGSLTGRSLGAEVSARFLAPEATYNESAGTVKVGVLVESLTGDPLPQPLAIEYAVNGSATAGADYGALSGSVSVVANGGAAAVAEISVALTNDAEPENTETVELELTDTAEVEVSDTNGRFALKIRDDDTPSVSFVTSAHTVKEDAGLVAVQVALSPAPDGPITVAYRVTGTAAAGTDYAALTGTLAVPTGAETVTIPIQVTDDTDEEPEAESVMIELLPVAEATGGVAAYQVGSASDFTLLIRDNEPPTVSFFKANSRVLESAGEVAVVAQLSRASTETIVVQYGLSGSASPDGDGQDYQAPEVSSVTFQPGMAQVNVPIAIVDDTEFEGLETIELTLAKPGNAGLGEIPTHTMTIVDNEKARVEFQATESSAVENVGSFAATVTLSEVAPEDIVIQYVLNGTATGDQDYYPPAQNSVTIYKGTSSSFLNFSIVDDTEKEKKETIVATITGSPSNVDIGVNNIHTLTILDNDQYPAKLISPEGQNASVPDVAIDGEGNAHIIWKANNNLWYTKIDKDYQVVVPAKEVYRSSSSAVLVPRIAVDRAGVVHVVHATTSRSILNYIRIEDGAYKMSRAFQIYPSSTYNNQEYNWPAIAVTPAGQPIVVAEGRVYDDATPAPNGINFIATVELGADGNPIIETRWAPFSRKFGVAFGSYSFDGYGRPDLAYDSTGNLHVVWRHKEDAKGAAPDPAWTGWSVVHARKGLKWKGKLYHEISPERNVLMTYGGPQIASSGARQMDIVWCSTTNAMYWKRIESNGDSAGGTQTPTLISYAARYPEVAGGFGKEFFAWMYEGVAGEPVQIYSSNTSDLTNKKSISDSGESTSFERMAARSASAVDYVWKEGAGVYYRSLSSGVTIESSENYNRLTRTLDIRARATDLIQQPITNQNADEFTWKLTDNSGTARGEGNLQWSESAGEWLASYTLPEGKSLEPGSYPIRYSISANTRGGQKLTGESLSVLTVAKPFTVIGTITDKEGKPVADATVAARIRKNQPPSREVQTGADGKYKLEDLVESDARIVTVSKPGYGENALPIEPPSSGAQVVIDLTLPDQTVGPAITAGKLTYGSGESVLLAGLSNFRDKYVVNVNWNGGTPKKVTFSSNDTKETKEIEVGNPAPDFFELEFDVSQWFSGVTNLGRYAITVVAEDQEGRKAERVEPINVVALPELFRLILSMIPTTPTNLDLFLSGQVTLVKLKNTRNLPFLGYLGPEVEVVLSMVYKLTNGEWAVGINGSMDAEAKKLSEGRKYYRGKERDKNNHRKVLFRYGEKEVEIKPSFTMSGKATPTAGVTFEKAMVGLEVAFKDTIISFLLTDLFPGGQIARFLDHLKKWKFDINSIQRLNIVGGLTGKGEAQLRVSPVGIENLDTELGASLAAVYNPRLYKALTAELSIGGEGAVKARILQIPELKGIEFKALVRAIFKWKDMEVVKGEYPFLTYPSEGGAGIEALFAPNSLLADGVSVTGQRPVSRAYLANGPSRFVASDASVGIQAVEAGDTALDRFRMLGALGAQPVRSATEGQVKADGESVTSGLEQADLTLVTNVYPDSSPALAAHGATLMLLYSADNGGADLQFSDIHWTRYDGTDWSAPAPIQTNTQGEFAPQVVFDGDGDAVAVWERVKDPNLTTADLDVIMPLYEIVWARWDHSAQTWSTPVALTENNYLDQCPQLCGPMADGSVLLTWKSNPQNYFVGSDASPTTVHWARFDANTNTWSAPASLIENLTGERAETLAGAGSLAVYAYTRESDLATSSTLDTEVYYTQYNGSSWSTVERLTNNGVLDDSIRAAVTATGKTYLVWQMGSDLVMNQDFETTTSLVRANSTSMGFMDFALAPNADGNLGLIWQAQTAEGTNAMYTVYDPASGVWSQDLRLFQDNAIEYAYAPAWDNLGNLTVAYNRQAVSLTTETIALDGGGSVTVGGVPTRGQADLAVVKRALVKDLAILPGDLTYYSGPLLSGEVVDFDIQVRNTGDLPVQGASVVLYDGNPAAGGVEVARRVLGDWFEGGTSVTVTLSWTVPEPVSAHTLYAIVDADAAVTEFNEYNNQQWVTLGGTDLSPMELVTSSAQVDGAARLVVRVRNAGGPESPVATLGVRPAGGGGAALATAAIPALAAGTSAEVAVDLPAGSVPPETAVKFDIRTDDAGAVEDVNRENDLLTAEVTGAVDESPAVATTVEVVTDLDEIPVAEAGTTVFHVWLSAMPSAPVSLAVSAVAGGDADLTVSNGATFTIQPSAWNTPVAVTLAAAADADSDNGTTQFQIAESGSTVGVVAKQVLAVEMDDDAQNAVGGTLATNTTWSDTTKDYVITSQLVIPAGVTLTIEPGVRVRHGGSLDFTAIKLSGTLVASDADFLFYTRAEYYSSWRFNGIDVLSGGNVQLNRCSLRSIERNYTDTSRWSAIVTSLEASTIQVKGCSFESLNTLNGNRTSFGVQVRSLPTATIGDDTTQPTALPCSFSGFYYGIGWKFGSGVQDIGVCEFDNCFSNVRIWGDVTGSAVVRNSGTQILFDNTNADQYASNGTVVVKGGGTLTFEPGSTLIADAWNRLLIVEAGGTLAMTGIEVDSIAPIRVYGTMQATETAFLGRTYRLYYASSRVNPIEVYAGGSADLQTCSFYVREGHENNTLNLDYWAAHVWVAPPDTANSLAGGLLTVDGCFFTTVNRESYVVPMALLFQTDRNWQVTNSGFVGNAYTIWTGNTYGVTASMASAPTFTGNFFENSSNYAVYNNTQTVIPASENWWGSATGPRYVGNAGGLGDPVSDAVDYTGLSIEASFPMVRFVNPTAGQERTNLTAGTALPAVELMAFRVTPQASQVREVGFRLSEPAGNFQWNQLANFRLAVDANGDGRISGSEQTTVGGTGLLLTEGTNQSVIFSNPFVSENSPSGGYILLADARDVTAGQGFTVALNDRFCRVPVGSGIETEVDSVRHMSGPAVILSNPAAGQLPDQLNAYATQQGVRLLGFQLKGDAAKQVERLTVRLTNVEGLTTQKVRKVSLIADTNGNGLVDVGEGAVGGTPVVSIAGGTGTIEFSRQAFATESAYLVVADFAYLSGGNRFAVGLSASDVKLVGTATVSGAAKTVTHVVKHPLQLSKSPAWQAPTNFGASASQDDVPILGFQLAPAGIEVQSLQMNMASMTGISIGEIGSVRVYWDKNGNGLVDAEDELVVGNGQVQNTETGAGTILFDSSFITRGDMIAVANFTNLKNGDEITFSIRSEGIAVGAGQMVSGTAPEARLVVGSGLGDNPNQNMKWTLTYRSPGGTRVSGRFNHAGDRVILGYDTGSAWVFDSESNTPLIMLKDHYDKVRYAGFSSDDSAAVTVSRDGAVYIWDLNTSGSLRSAMFADLLVTYAVPSPDFSKLMVITEGKGMLLDIDTQKRLWEYVPGNASVNAIAYSPDGQTIAVGTSDNFAYLVNAETGVQVGQAFLGHSQAVTAVGFTGDGSHLMTASSDATVQLWRISTHMPVRTISLTGQNAQGATVSYDGKRICMITGTGNQAMLRMYDESGLELYQINLNTVSGSNWGGTLENVTFDDAGERVLVNSAGNGWAPAAVFRVSDGAFIGQYGPQGAFSDQHYARPRISQDGERVFYETNWGMNLVQRETGKTIRRSDGLTNVSGFDISNDGSRVAWITNEWNGRMQIEAVSDEGFSKVLERTVGTNSYTNISLSPDGNLAALGDRLYQTKTGDLFANYASPDGNYQSAFSGDGSKWGFAIANSKSLITLRTSDPNAVLYNMTNTNPYTPYKMLYHPDGRRVGMVDPNTGVQMYDMPTQLPVGLYRFEGRNYDAALSQDGSLLLIGGDNTVRLYDVKTGRILRYFYPMHSSLLDVRVRSVQFARNDTLIMIAWSYNYVETYERSQADHIEVTPSLRVLKPGESQEYTIELVYDDSTRRDITPRTGVENTSVSLEVEPASMATLEGNVITVAAGAEGEFVLRAQYRESGRNVTGEARVLVNEEGARLVSLVADPNRLSLNPGVFRNIRYTAWWDDGYSADVSADVTLTADKPEDMEILGQNVKVNYTARPGNYLVTGSYTTDSGDTITTDTVVTLYGPKTEWERYQVTGGGYGLSGAYSADGTQLAVGSSSGAINLYDVGATPSQYEIRQVIMAHEGQIAFVAYLDAARIVTVGGEGTIKTWAVDEPTSTPLTVFTHDAGIVCAALSGSGATAVLAVGDEIGRVGLFNLSENAFTWLESAHTGKTQCVALDGTQVLSGGADNVVMVFNRADGSRVRPNGLLVHTKPVTAVGYLGTDGFYSAGDDQTLTLWRKSDLEVIDRYEYPAAVTAAKVIGDQLYVATNDPVSTWIYNKDGLLLRWLEHPPAEGKIIHYLLDPSGQYVVTGRTTGRKTVGVAFMGIEIGEEEKISEFSSFQFWEVGRGIFRGSLAHSFPMSAAHLSEDGKTVFTQDPKRTMKWTPGTNRVDMDAVRLMETGYFIAPKFEGMDFTQDSSKLATRVGVSIFMYDTANDLLWKTLHTPASAFAVSPEGTRMVTADSKVRLWDLANLSQIREESRVAKALDFRLENHFLGGMYEERFIGIWNSAGLLFNGMKTRHSPVQLFVNQLGTRCVAVTEEVSGDEIEQTHMFYLETYDISDLVTGPTLVNEIFIMSVTVEPMMGESVDASFTVAISEDGTLALVGVSGGSKPGQSARPVRLINMNDGSTIREFLPASGMGEENIGAAAVGFGNNDQTLMIGWREGYVSLYHRVLAGNLEVYLDFTETSSTQAGLTAQVHDGVGLVVSKAMAEGAEINASPGNVINGRAFVNYVNGTRLNVTSTIEFEAAPADYVQIEGANITIDPDAPTPSDVTLTARYVELGTEMQTQVTLHIIDPQAPVVADIPDVSLTVGEAYTGPTPEVVQGVQPIAWTLVTGPEGMTIDAGTGVVNWTSATEGVTTVTIRATNALGSDDESWRLSVYPKNLTNALDAQELPMTWSTEGDATWFYQTDVTHDGVDAAQSGNTGYNVPSTLRADISTDEHRTLTFWWKLSAHNDTTLRFYIDDAQQLAINGETDWTSQTVEVPAGTHALKWVYTRGWYTGGSNAGWVDQVSFTPSVWPERPVLLTPAGGATNIEPDVTFTWSGGALTDSYDFYLWKTNETKPSVPTQAGLTGKSFQVPGGLTYWTDYRWQVVARNTLGTIASAEATFRTAYLTAPVTPATPNPEDGSTTAPVTLTLDWADSKRAETYDIYLWKATEWQPWPPTSSGLTVSQFKVPQTLLYDVEYKWKVVARNTAGGTEGPTWTFTTNLLKPEAPSQPVPEDGATTASVALQLDWADTPMATSYDLKFWRADKPMPTTYTAEGLTVSQFPMTEALDYLTTYSWQVVAKNRIGSTEGAVWTFRTDIQAPFSPYPENASPSIPVDVTLTWGRSAGALAWDLFFWKKGLAKPTEPTVANLTDPAWKPTAELDFDTEYQWQVVVKGKTQQLAGPEWSFRTHIEGAPSAAKWLNPPDGSIGASIGINLAWEPSARAGDYYMVYLWRAVDSKPGWPNYAYSTEFDPGNLAYNTDYLWQVVAHNATGDTVGPIWAFRTQRLGTPELVIPDSPSPYVGQTNVPVDTTLNWSDATDAVWYNVFLWPSTQVRPTVPTSSGLTASSYKPAGSLEGNTRYYWLVTAGNAKGETTGLLWSFTTETPALPGEPSGPTPWDGATSVLPTTALDWYDASAASRYDLYLWKSTETEPVEPIAANLTASQYTPPAMLEGLTTYKWRVVARNIVGETPGPVWTFSTRAIVQPDKPQLISPEDNAQGVLENPTFEWGASANAERYILSLWKQGDATPATVTTNWTTCWWGSSMLESATTYTWQVTAENWAGQVSSEVFTFVTRVAGAPGVPSWPTPSNGAFDVALLPTFTWSGGSEALSHDFYLWKATDPAPSTPTATDLTVNQYTPAVPLQSNTAYNWKVVAKNASGGTTGPVWSFSTLYVAPTPSPQGLMASQGEWGSKVTVSWQPVTGGNGYYYYRVYRALSPTDTPEALGPWQYGATFEDVTAKRRQTGYYWVQAATGTLGENAGALAGPVQGWLYLPTLPLRAYKITYSKDISLSFDTPTTGALTLGATTAKSALKIKWLPKGLPAGVVSGQIVKPGTAYLETREIPSVVIPGAFGVFASDAPIFRMQASSLKSVTAANGLEEYTGGDVAALKITASYNSSRTNLTEFAVTSIQTAGTVPLSVLINGVVLERLQTSQPVKFVKVATRKYKDAATKEKRFSQAGIGALGDVEKDAKGGALLSVQDSWLSAPSFGLVQSIGGPVVLGLLEGTQGAVAKVNVKGAPYATTAVGTRILQGNLRVTELKSAGPIALLSAKYVKVGSVYLGGYLGFSWEPTRMTVLAQPKAGSISCITTVSGQNGVSGLFYAGYNAADDSAAYTGGIKTIITSRTGRIEGEAFISNDPKAKPKFKPTQPSATQFVIHTGGAGLLP